ncbi:MAG: hypothetical protein RML94_16385 [Bacteroidia bacterium]|nr:hypothetical protein [Bacteroidia bacterium]
MGVSLWAFRRRSCPQGRRAAGYAIASVLRTAYAPSACLTQSSFLMFCLIYIPTFALTHLILIIIHLQI